MTVVKIKVLPHAPQNTHGGMTLSSIGGRVQARSTMYTPNVASVPEAECETPLDLQRHHLEKTRHFPYFETFRNQRDTVINCKPKSILAALPSPHNLLSQPARSQTRPLRRGRDHGHADLGQLRSKGCQKVGANQCALRPLAVVELVLLYETSSRPPSRSVEAMTCPPWQWRSSSSEAPPGKHHNLGCWFSNYSISELATIKPRAASNARKVQSSVKPWCSDNTTLYLRAHMAMVTWQLLRGHTLKISSIRPRGLPWPREGIARRRGNVSPICVSGVEPGPCLGNIFRVHVCQHAAKVGAVCLYKTRCCCPQEPTRSRSHPR